MASFSASPAQPKPKKFTLFLNISFLFIILFYVATSYFLDRSDEQETIMNNSSVIVQATNKIDGCAGINDFIDYKSKCMYVKSHIGCNSKGYISYLQIFYCTCGQVSLLGYVLLLLWLLVLFYLLGDTAANYFCSSLENLSSVLKLSPAIAGVTLLSLGNGAPDVFSSIISFTRSGDGDVGLNSILGGAFFVSCVVVGVISTLVSSKEVSIDKYSFIRDASFLLLSLCSLLLIILIGKITLLGSIAFLSIYLFYVCVVCAMHFHFCKENKGSTTTPAISPHSKSQEDLVEMGIPLLGCVDDEKPILEAKSTIEDSFQSTILCDLDSPFCFYLSRVWSVLELPLYLPRRLTIPVVGENRWSKPFAVAAVALAPILLAALLDKKLGSRSSLVMYMIAGLIGMVLGNLAYVTTKESSPPKTYLLLWLVGGFVMGVVWTYIIAEELVSLLVSLGYIFGINPSVLGLTVLAWGNSIGDLIANGAMAVNGGADGVQIAISGCYAGPMFNTLLGLGVSFVISSWSNYPSCYEIPDDPSLYETLGFMIGGLIWALVALPRKKMRLDKLLGVGLLSIYFCFLGLRLATALGFIKLQFHGLSFQSLKKRGGKSCLCIFVFFLFFTIHKI